MNENRDPLEIGLEIGRSIDDERRDGRDRVAGLVGAAYLDDLLDALPRQVFIDDGDGVRPLLGPDRALRSTGSRYQLAFCLGLIPKDVRDDLLPIRFNHAV